jgi:hypothetical protein
MIEDDTTQPAEPRDGELLLYDYFKYLTSLVLITLGGLLIVMKDFDPTDVKPGAIVTTLLIVSLSGVLSFGGAGEIARARYLGRPVKPSVNVARIVAPALLAIGFGHFLAMFVDSLS